MPRTGAEWAAAFATLSLLLVAALFGHLNFARWDNTETFLPAIWYAHSELLHGRFPFWNPYQHMGEPLHALGIGGALYLPYTAAVALTKLAGFPPSTIFELIAVSHATFGAIGMTRLSRELGVRPSLAVAASLSAMLSGFALVPGAMWVHVIPNLAWSVWAMWALYRIVRGDHTRAHVIIAVVALAVVFFTGHVQSGVNVWLAVWSWAFAVAIALRAPARRWAKLLLIGVAAALIATPSVLPTALILPDADRLAGSSVTAGRGFNPFAMLGALVPGIRGSDTALVHTVLVTPFMGAWVPLALVLGIGVLLHRRRDADRSLVRVFAVTCALGLLFVWLNFGPPAKLYSLLHSVPIFSHFRIAYKYFERAMPLLVMAGALGLELAARDEPPRWYLLATLALAIGGITMWLIRPGQEPFVVLGVITAVAVFSAMLLLPHRSAAAALVPLTMLQCALLIAMTHSPRASQMRSKPYVLDRRPDAPLDVVVDTTRVLPLSEGPESHPFTRPLGIFFAPTLDGYASVTGHRFALTSRHMSANFPGTAAGTPHRKRLPFERLLGSRFLKMTNVSHLIVDPTDTAALNAVARAYPNGPRQVTDYAVVFEITPGPRAYFATEKLPGNPAATHEALWGRGAIDAAATGDTSRRSLPATAQVTELDWRTDKIEARVNAPDGGLLVFSAAHSGEWVGQIDGRRTDVLAVNEIFAGVWVPAGAERVRLQIRKWPLYAGLLAAIVGIVVCLNAGAQLNLPRARRQSSL